jgi:hypothetical protein
MAPSKAPRIRQVDALLEETRLVHQSRDNGLQWVIDNMATKDDITALRGDIAALAEVVKDGFATLGVNIANGDHRLRHVK